MMRHYQKWTACDDTLLRELYADHSSAEIARRLTRTTRAIYDRAKALGLKKSATYIQTHCRIQKGQNVSSATCFGPGNPPWNKGLSLPGWSARGRMAEAQFKPGELAGAAAQLLAPVGTEVVDSYGYLKRKVRDDAQPGESRKNWRMVHVLLWEEHHGPVPRGMIVVFRNRNKADIRIDNLELISRTESMRRNHIARYPCELRHALRLVAKLKRSIRQREEVAP